MSRLILLLTFGFGLPAMADLQDLRIRCATLQPTTSVVADVVNDKVKMKITHHKGISEAPIFNGTVTSRDLPLLQADALVFARLGTVMEFEWPTSSCQSYGSGLVSCYASDQPVEINGMKVSSVSFNTGRTTERTFSTTSNKAKVSLWFSVDGRFRQVSFEYDSLDCQINFEGPRK